MKKPVNVAITGAAGQIGYALAFRVASGQMLGADQPINLHLLEITPALRPGVRGQTTRPAPLEIKMSSSIRPREIQTRVRAGESAPLEHGEVGRDPDTPPVSADHRQRRYRQARHAEAVGEHITGSHREAGHRASHALDVLYDHAGEKVPFMAWSHRVSQRTPVASNRRCGNGSGGCSTTRCRPGLRSRAR